MTYTVPHYIDGKTLHRSAEHFHTIYNPALGEAIGKAFFC